MARRSQMAGLTFMHVNLDLWGFCLEVREVWMLLRPLASRVT